MAKELSYSELLEERYNKLINEVLPTLPLFCNDYMSELTHERPGATRYGYLCDIRIFLSFIQKHKFSNMEVKEIGYECLEQITPDDIEEYMYYLGHFTDEYGRDHTNGIYSKYRKISSLSVMYRFFIKKRLLKSDPTCAIDRPRQRNNEKTVMEIDEAERLVEAVESGSHLSDKELQYHRKTKYRDLAIIMLFLFSEIRISELVALNKADIDFDHPCEDIEGNIVYKIAVNGKGGKFNEITVPFRVLDSIRIYLEVERASLLSPDDEDNPAVFLSLRGNRIAKNSVEHMVKKYVQPVISNKKITPQKLRI